MTNAVLRWHAPTHYTDGSSIQEPLTYNIYRTTGLPRLVDCGVTGTEYCLELHHHHRQHCFYVKAFTSNAASAGSNIACTLHFHQENCS